VAEKTGEIAPRAVAPAPASAPTSDEPSILVSDLAAAHVAATAALAKADLPPPPSNAASASREREIAEVRKDAVAFSDAEEAFFKRADQPSPTHQVTKLESFEDLDEGYEPPKFWDRVFGRRKRPSSTGIPMPNTTKPKK
jgi:hypothetical protein